MVKLLERGFVGDQPGFANLPVRVDELRRITVSSDAFREVVRPALQHASLKLDQIGFRNFGSMTNESRYSHVLGGNAGRLIRKFYRSLLDDLGVMGYSLPLEQVNGNGRSKLGPVVIDHRVVAENLIAFELHREAAESGDDRKLRRALGLVWSPRRKKWISHTDIPRLEFYDPRLMELFGSVVSRKVSLRNVLASLFLSRSRES
jgi:hypothetical protein